MDRFTPADEAQRAAPLLRLLESGRCDEDLASHSTAVGELARQIAIRMGLPERTVERLRLAGALHDIGKLEIPCEILCKTETLTEEEWILIRRHPEAGYRRLLRAGLPELALWVRCHHERPDGSGYPRRMPGAEIPIEACILALADSYSAMTDDRHHQAAMTEDEALAEVRRCAGSQFDSKVAAILHEVVSSSAVAS